MAMIADAHWVASVIVANSAMAVVLVSFAVVATAVYAETMEKNCTGDLATVLTAQVA